MEAEHPSAHLNVAADVDAGSPRPPRARRLLAAIIPQCVQGLEPMLGQCLDSFDKELYQQADNARSQFAQQRCFDSRAAIQQHRAAFMRDFIDALCAGFAGLGGATEMAPAQLAHRPLSLLGHEEHELVAAMDKLTARGEARHGPALTELSYRFAVLVGAPPLDGDALPIGPASLGQALRDAVVDLDLPSEHQLLLLRTFEQAVIVACGPLYEAINAQLLADGLLPQLRPYVAPKIARSDHGQTSAGASASGTENIATAPPIAVLETLRNLLSQRHRGDSSARAPSLIATQDELQTALGALQQHLAQVTDQASRELRSAQRLRDELLQQLNADKPPGATPTQLSAEQDDTVELVAMLFEQIGQQLHHGPQARSVLGDLQVPMLRMAVSDREFFNQREHPARQLLGAVAEAANDWLDGPDGESDHQLADRLKHLVARAQTEPPSAGLYTTLLADIEHQLAQLNRRAQAAERRHVEAVQGRERLDQARQQASELLAERFASHPPRGLLRALLDRAWADVMALTLLQHGKDSPAFAQRLRVTDQLLGRLPVDEPDLLRREVQAGLQQIGMHAEEAEQVATRLVGTTATETAAVATVTVLPVQPAATTWQALPEVSPAAPATPPPTATRPTVADAPPGARHTPTPTAPVAPLPATARELPSATDLALRLKQRQRLGESPHARPASSPADAEPPLGPQEARIHNRLRQLPYGSWFEFTDPATDEIVQRKLAWFSPISGNSLFVTRRGLRGEEMNLRELARAIAGGRVRELPPQRDGLIDRAWHNLTGKLLRATSPSAKPRRP